MHPSTKLVRTAAAEALTAAGFHTTASTLATLAPRGGRPPYDIFNKRARYTWSDLLEWAEARVKQPRQRKRDTARPESAHAA